MANFSPNINLELPTSPEHYDIGVFNKNNMVIDSEINKINIKIQSQDELLATKQEITEHNTSSAAHDDIRTLISTLTTRLNALADSDDTTLDQLSEIVDYIKNNKDLIDGITTSKVNVSDIISSVTSLQDNTLSGKIVDALVIKEILSSIKTITYSTTEPTTVAEGEIVMVYEDGDN